MSKKDNVKKIEFTEQEMEQIKENLKVELIDNKVQEQVKSALNNNVELTEEEYAKKTGTKVKESLRHKRVLSNFLGTQLNFNYQILQSLYQQEALLTEIYKLLEKRK